MKILAIYHCSVKIGSRAKGQSAVAAAAYRSGNKLTDKETGIVCDYTRKEGVVFSEISLCKNAPAEYADRATLWNAVHKVEKAKNAQLWREIEVALPQEFSRAEQIETVREYVRKLVEKGMCADWSLHDKGDGNPHAHIMLTMRSIKDNGEWAGKSRKVYDLDEHGERIFQKVDKSGRKQYKSHKEDYNDWNKKERIEEWRAAWSDCCNTRLAEKDCIDHRSYARQGIDLIPTVHEGHTARKIAATGGKSELVQRNEQIRQYNNLLQRLAEKLNAVGEELKQLIEEKEKEKESALNGRVAELLARRKRTVTGIGTGDNGISRPERGTPNGERTTERANRGAIGADTAAILRETAIDRTSTAASEGSKPIIPSAQSRPADGVRAGTANQGVTENLLRAARAANTDTETTIKQSTAKVASSTASRADRNAERERQAAESRRRDEEERRRAEEESRRAEEEKRRRAAKRKKNYFEL